MKIKTFNKSDEKEINAFLDTVRVLQNGVYQSDETITFQYIDGKFPEASKENDLIQLYSELLDNTNRLKSLKRDLEYINRKEPEESDGKDKRAIQKSIAKLEIDREMIQEDIKELA